MIAYTPFPTISIGSVHLSTHGIMMAVGFLVAFLLVRHEAKTNGLNDSIVENMAIIAVIAVLVGARVVYILTLGEGMTFVQMLKIWEGVLSSHGGYLFGILASLAYLKWKKVPIFTYTDLIAPYFL